jgi:hypothetical protein
VPDWMALTIIALLAWIGWNLRHVVALLYSINAHMEQARRAKSFRKQRPDPER